VPLYDRPVEQLPGYVKDEPDPRKAHVDANEEVLQFLEELQHKTEEMGSPIIKPKSKLKIVLIAAGVVAALSLGIFFGMKILASQKT
jgi:hypothetical protein